MVTVLLLVAAFTVLRAGGPLPTAVGADADAARTALILAETPVTREPLNKWGLTELGRWPGWTALAPILLVVAALGATRLTTVLAPATHPVRRRAPPIA
jgi:hypothetical protein